MVTVTDYQARKTEQGKEFFALTIQSGVEVVVSQKGSLYATARKASLPSTFDEAVCKSLIGTQLPGSVHKVQVEPYEYKTEEGELIIRNHRFEYQPLEENEASSTAVNAEPAKQPANGHLQPTI